MKMNLSYKATYFLKLEIVYFWLSLFIGGVKAFEYDFSKGFKVFLYVFLLMQLVILATNFRLIFKKDT